MKRCARCKQDLPENQFAKDRNRADGLYFHCRTCKSEVTKFWYEQNKGLYEQRKKKAWAVLRKEVIDEYGGICWCCGETGIEFLTIDHVNGDGAEHRKRIGKSTKTLYKWLKENKYPKGRFQVLCFNCNMAKRRNPECPHKLYNTTRILSPQRIPTASNESVAM